MSLMSLAVRHSNEVKCVKIKRQLPIKLAVFIILH